MLIALRKTAERRNSRVVWECKCDCGNTAFVPAVYLRSGYTTSCGCMQTLDLTGQRFGQLIAVRPTSERRRGYIVWECKCDCGNTAYMTTHDLRRGNVSCGCVKPEKKAEDITGQRFGKLVAIRPTDERINGSVVWECKCDCGNTAFVDAGSLRKGHTTSCGCAKAMMRGENLTGQRFGQLVAIRPTDGRISGSVVWECKCDCGNTKFASLNYLRSGHTTSCGCAQTVDITGQRFGKLIAVRPTSERRRDYIVWECKCDCRNTAYVTVYELRSGNTTSCGCEKYRKSVHKLRASRFKCNFHHCCKS